MARRSRAIVRKRTQREDFGVFFLIPFIPLIAAGITAAVGVTVAVVSANVQAANREEETQRWQAQIEEAERQRATQERIAFMQAEQKARQQKTLLYLGGGALGLGALYFILR